MSKCEYCKKEVTNMVNHLQSCAAVTVNPEKRPGAEKTQPPALEPNVLVEEVRNPEEIKKVSQDEMLKSPELVAIESLTSQIGSLIAALKGVKDTPAQQMQKEDKVVYEEKADETYPEARQPVAYRKIVDQLLGKDFGFDVLDIDPHKFQFIVYVPEKYSSLSLEDKQRGIKDIRTRVIPIVVGENGVKEWCTLIRTNLAKYYTQSGKQSPFVD